ncbi:MAG: DNA-protecting protein DprA [Rhodobacteraceae bacterium]|nr:DNA-protecting protein DprA [Paracoccaceae bacterium]
MAEDLLPSPHPLTPPRSEEDWVSWLRLLRSRRVGPTTFHRLMVEHGSAEAALAALPEVARTAGVEKYAPCPRAVAEQEFRAGHMAGARLIAHGAPGYPVALTDLPDAPPFLWLLGDATMLSRPMVALVGARNASSLGTRMARALAEGLGEAGFTVVSGLARGVDTAAHLAALEHGTLAVMAGGVDVVYPAENAVLAQEIAERGLRVSEQPMGVQPQARHFPTRNRIISGLAMAVVVVEAAAKSGSLITARDALDQGREVLAVPGHPFDARAAGCNMLIRDGATLVRGTGDVIEVLTDRAAGNPAAVQSNEPEKCPQSPGETTSPEGPQVSDRTASPEARNDAPAQRPETRRAATVPGAGPEKRDLSKTTGLHRDILARLGPSPVAEDQLIRDLGVPAGTVSPELVTLELEGRIARQPGGLLALA